MDPQPLIEFDHVSRHFGSVAALDDVSLRVMPGRIGLLGPNGAGKSTLLKLVMGLIPPSAGAGAVLGVPLGSQSNTRLRQRIGFMPETEGLVPGLTGI